MPHRGRPRRGSMQYSPKKRAKRLYPRITVSAVIKETKPLSFAGWKAGMTHVKYTDSYAKSPTYGKVITKAATIIETPSLLVCGIKFYSNGRASGEKWMENIPKNVEKKTGKQKGKDPENADDARLIVTTKREKQKTEVFEVPLGGKDKEKIDYANSLLGKEINAKDIFSAGEEVDVTAITKGHGFTGPVKRFGIRIQTRKDQQMHRHVGSIGSVIPRRVDRTVPRAGQFGFFQRTERKKKILMIDNDPKKINPKGGLVKYGIVKGDFMLVEGSVPGPRKRLIVLKKTLEKTNPIEISYISLDSRQGV